ncbi:META domain-containing protein [Deinococcus radiophilus]
MYRLEGQTLQLEGTLVSTMKFCESTETMPQLTETLAAAPQVEQQGDTLILTANDLRWEFVRQ